MAAHVENDIFIDAPLDLVWAMTNDVAMWPLLFEEYASTDILHRDGGYTRFRLTLHPDARGRIWSWICERHADEDNRTVVARRVETGPFEYMTIRWSYEPRGDGVLIRWIHDFAVRADATVSDSQLAQTITLNAPRQLSLIRERIEAVMRASVRGALS